MGAEADRTLLLLRHGKAGDHGSPDHDRPLVERGRRESGRAGDWIRSAQPSVDAVLCSTATRTRETLAATGLDAPATYAEQIYQASPQEILDLVRETADSARTLLVVGHSPGIPGLAHDLAGDGSDPDTLRTVGHFPTSTVAVLRLACAWADLGYGDARLEAVHRPIQD